MNKTIVGYGELLWDVLPKGKQLGGAPGNFVYHAIQCNLEGYVVSAVGKDDLGIEILQECDVRGLRGLIATVDKPTGTVDVELDAQGVPQYIIHENVAWDDIPFTDELAKLAKRTDCVCFGTLVQRSDISRKTLYKFLDLMKKDALIVFDINLRQHFYDKQCIEQSLNKANILKINEDEVLVVGELFGYATKDKATISKRILKEFQLKMVILTCGADCSYVFTASEESYMKTPHVEVADTVGAGDSFTAVFCALVMQGKKVWEAHRAAVDISAYVCTKDGAMPVWSHNCKNRVENKCF